MDNVRTVSDTKRSFYTVHTRPINSIYRRVVEELMVEMHLLSVNANFRYDPIYALGVVSTFDRFMQGYQPQKDKDSIFNALCQALEQDPQQYRQDAEWVSNLAAGLSSEQIVDLLSLSATPQGSESLRETLEGIANNDKFKYSRLFAIGLLNLLELADIEFEQDAKKREAALDRIGEALKLPRGKIEKDLDLYRSNLEKMVQAQSVMEDILQADRRKRDERAQAKTKGKDTVATPTDESKDEKDKGEAASES